MGKVQVKSYTFNAVSKTVTFTDYVTVDLDSILLITNVTHGNAIIYNFAGKPTTQVPTGLGGTVSGNVLTLACSTSGMSNTNKLQIWYWDIEAVEGLTNTQLRATPVPVSGTFWQATQPVSGPLTDAQLRAATVPISGTVNTGLTQPLTNTELRATAVPVSGTFWQATQPVSGPLTDTQLRATSVSVSTGLTQPLTDTQLRATAVPVSGTFWQAIQPISGTVTANAGTNLNTSDLALETGGNLETIAITDFATSAKQDTSNGYLSNIAAYDLGSFDKLADIEATLLLIKDTDGIKKITNALPAGSAIIGKFGIDQTTPGTTNKVSIGTDGIVAIGAGSAVMGHVIADSGSTTAVTGNVTVIQGTAGNLHVAATLDVETTKVIGTINVAAAQTIAVTNAGVFAVQSASTLTAETTKVIGTVNIASAQTIAVTNAGTFAVQSTLTAETTKVIGVIRASDGAGNLLTSNSTTFSAKFGLDANILGVLGTAFTTAGKVDVKAADGDVFIRQTTASNLNATVVGTGTFVTQSTLAAETTKVIGTVNIASSQTVGLVAGSAAIGKLAANDGVDIGDVTLNGSSADIPIKDSPQASGGLTTFHLVSAGSTNATNIKNSAGQVYGWYIYNSNSAIRKVAFHNDSGTPTAGASIFFSLVLPPNSGANVSIRSGITFSTGIAITTVTTAADSGSTAVTSGDLTINIWYK